jgi:hypothetical protein
MDGIFVGITVEVEAVGLTTHTQLVTKSYVPQLHVIPFALQSASVDGAGVGVSVG